LTKSEIELSSLHEQPYPSASQDRDPPFRRSHPYGKGREKISSAKNPRNPLKSLDSDERIQANPRKSNSERADPRTWFAAFPWRAVARGLY
jgi:hypothetical protein